MGTGATASTADLGALSERRSRTVHAILGAAMHIVMEEGVAGLSMSALARRAGVSRQTLYNYFPDVEAVLAGMVEMGDEGGSELAERVGAEKDPRAAIRLFVAAAVASVASGHPSPAALTAALPVTLREASAAHAQRTERLIIDVLRRGREDGIFRADVDPELDGRLLYGAVLAAADLAPGPDADPQRFAVHLGETLLRMVLADASTAAGARGS